MNGVEAIGRIRIDFPQARIIVLTTFARPGYLRRALDAGARGYLLKEPSASEIAEAIRRVHSGLRAVDPTLAAEAWSADEDPLSDRERQILQRAGHGRSSAEIATELRLSEGTVRNYLSEAIVKLGAPPASTPPISPAPAAGCSSDPTRVFAAVSHVRGNPPSSKRMADRRDWPRSDCRRTQNRLPSGVDSAVNDRNGSLGSATKQDPTIKSPLEGSPDRNPGRTSPLNFTFVRPKCPICSKTTSS